MRLALLCLLLTVLCTCVRAQNYEDFAPFRPGTAYYYDNPFAEDAPTNPAVSPVLGFHWPLYFELTPTVTVNKVAIPTASPGVVRIIPHFVGAILEETIGGSWTMAFEERVEPPFFFRLDYNAEEGEEFMVNETVLARVDSVVSTPFFGITDDVKYISLRDTVDGTRHPTIQLSRNFGMLSGPYFSDLSAISEPLQLLGLSGETNWSPNGILSLGEDYLEPFELALAGSEVYQEETSPEVFDGVLGIRVTHRQWTAGNPGCDPVADGSFTPYRVREVNYFLPEDGGAPYDSTVVPSYRNWQSIYFMPYASEEEWRALPLGSVYTDVAGTTRVVLPINDECMGVGFRLGDKLISGINPDEMVVDGATSGLIYYRHSMIPAFEPASDDHGQRRLVGIDLGSTICGTIFDFDHLYTSITNFPDDERVRLAPNPATDRVMISVPMDLGSVRLEVYDAAGRLLRTTTATGGDRWLPINTLQTGIYTVVLLNGEGAVARRRMVKQ